MWPNYSDLDGSFSNHIYIFSNKIIPNGREPGPCCLSGRDGISRLSITKTSQSRASVNSLPYEEDGRQPQISSCCMIGQGNHQVTYFLLDFLSLEFLKPFLEEYTVHIVTLFIYLFYYE